MTTDQPPPTSTQPPPVSAPLRPHRGILILVLGILGLILCPPFGIAAWLMGNSDLREIRQGYMDPSGEGLTQGGRICGIVGTILFVVGILISGLLLLMFGASLSFMHR